MKHTALSSSSKKFKMLCCLTSALFLRDDTNFCGAHPAHLFHTVQMLTNTQSLKVKKKKKMTVLIQKVKIYPLSIPQYYNNQQKNLQ